MFVDASLEKASFELFELLSEPEWMDFWVPLALDSGDAGQHRGRQRDPLIRCQPSHLHLDGATSHQLSLRHSDWHTLVDLLWQSDTRFGNKNILLPADRHSSVQGDIGIDHCNIGGINRTLLFPFSFSFFDLTFASLN